MASLVHVLKTEFRLVDSGYTRNAAKIVAKTREVSREQERAKKSSSFLSANVSTLGKAWGKLSGWAQAATQALQFVTRAAMAAAAAFAAIAGATIFFSQQAAQIERLKLGLDAYAENAQEAEENYRRLLAVAKLPGLGIEEALQGGAGLMAVGFNARLAERALKAFGNALALSGRGKEELFGVITALSQIVSKGKVSAEEILQIAERVPQIREVMKRAFDTANTEDIQKMGITVEDFILRLVDAMEELPTARGGAGLGWENFVDGMKLGAFQIGNAINRYMTPALNKAGETLALLGDMGVFEEIGKTWADVVFGAGASEDAIERAIVTFATFAEMVVERGAVVKETFIEFANVLIRVYNWLAKIINTMPANWALNKLGLTEPLKQIPEIGSDGRTGEGGFFDELQDRTEQRLDQLARQKKRAEEEAAKKAAKDAADKGGFSQRYREVFGSEDPAQGLSALDSIAANTKATAEHTARMVEIRDFALGGNDVRRFAMPHEMGLNGPGRGRTIQVSVGGAGKSLLDQFISATVLEVIESLNRQGLAAGS